ncbi:MAG: cobalamin-dependent protein [Nitrospirota bacterium]
MKLKLIYPEWGQFPLLYRRYIPVMGPASLAALTPSEWEVEFIDERVEQLVIKKDADMVGISLMTPQALRAYEIAEAYRAIGIPVILGGVHVSLAPEEALLHADTIVIGEAELVWQRLLEDFKKGQMEKIYKCESPALDIPFPRWNIVCNGKGYLPMNSIQVSRGCPVNCELCSVPQSFGTEFRMRNIDSLIKEAELLDKYIFIVNDNLHLSKRRSGEFLTRLKEVSKEWVGLSPLKIGGDHDFLNLLKESHCWAMYIDLSPWISAGLNDIIDGVQVKKAGEYIARIKGKGIKVIASFVFGFDHDDKGIFEKTVSFARKHDIDEVEFHILTPYPKSRLYDRLKAQGRLITYKYSEYTTSRVVYSPAKMTPDELYRGYITAWKEFYTDEYEDTPAGPLVRTFRCFPLKREDLQNYNKGKWVEAVLKRET